jgi:hypothetical protein
MSQLEIFEHPDDIAIEALSGGMYMRAPGTWVKHISRPRSMGIVIALTEDYITVLWSVCMQRMLRINGISYPYPMHVKP